MDVRPTAIGPGGEDLVGNYENTHIYEVMAGSLGIAGLSPTSGTVQEMPETLEQRDPAPKKSVFRLALDEPEDGLPAIMPG